MLCLVLYNPLLKIQYIFCCQISNIFTKNVENGVFHVDSTRIYVIWLMKGTAPYINLHISGLLFFGSKFLPYHNHWVCFKCGHCIFYFTNFYFLCNTVLCSLSSLTTPVGRVGAMSSVTIRILFKSLFIFHLSS